MADQEIAINQEMVISQPSTFDYTQLDSDTATFLQEQATEIKASWRRTQEELIAIGKRLIAAKERLPHGLFLPWIAAEFGMSNSTSWRLMQIAEGKSFKVKDLTPQIETSVLTRPIAEYGFLLHHDNGRRHVYKPIDGVLLELEPSYADLCKGLWDRCERLWTDTNFVTDEMREQDPIIRTLRNALDNLIATGVPTNDHHGWMSLGFLQRTGLTYMERPFDGEQMA